MFVTSVDVLYSEMNVASRRRGALTQTVLGRVASALEQLSAAAWDPYPQLAAARALSVSFPDGPVMFHTPDPYEQCAWQVASLGDEQWTVAPSQVPGSLGQASIHPKLLPEWQALWNQWSARHPHSSPRVVYNRRLAEHHVLAAVTSCHPDPSEDDAVLEALTTPLLHWSQAAHALGLYCPTNSSLLTCLDAFEQPGYVVNPASGNLVFANRFARHSGLRPGFLQTESECDLTVQQRRLQLTEHSSVSELRPHNHSLWLVVPSEAPPSTMRCAPALPPTLNDTARLLCTGASDKDIAQRLGVEHSTARTYTSRVLRKLQLSGRRELMQRYVPEQFPPSSAPPANDTTAFSSLAPASRVTVIPGPQGRRRNSQ